jgi:deoxyadenosine/deoxycytidine kinase
MDGPLLPVRYRYIAIEGPIGAGKTSLCRRIADRARCELLLEDPGANPFLPRFYEEPDRYALQTQLFFLFQRLQQIQSLAQSDLFARPTVSDFMLAKDPLFARLTLNDDEYRLYQEVYRHLETQAPVPDLVIYLQAGVETLAERVRRRGIGYERGITDEYLLRLADSYARFFYQYDEAPVLIVNSENLNFVDRPADFDLLLARIRGMRGPREFFNLAG